jgi:hypothetical protein
MLSSMNILIVLISVFIVLEGLNVVLLYFRPSSNKGNAMGAFKALDKAKRDPEVYALVKYLINWVAGTKLIFIGLLIVIIFTADNNTLIFAVIALIISIATFYWRLYPAIKSMDKDDQIKPKGYSKTLVLMISVFILAFIIGLIIHVTNNPLN